MKQIQLERQVVRLNAEEFSKLLDLEREVEGYFENNFSGITIYLSSGNLIFEYGGKI